VARNGAAKVAGVSLVPAAVGDVATPTKAAVEIERDGVGREGEGRGKRTRGLIWKGTWGGRVCGKERGGRGGFWEGNRGRVCGEEREGRGGLWAGNRGRGEGYVGRKGEEEEDCGQGIGEGYVGRKGEEKEDSGKGIRGLNAEPQ